MTSPYNIDALRRPDGTYADASAKLIRGALKCGHTAHLQTSRGVVAFRPFTLHHEHLEGERGELRKKLWPSDRPGLNWLVEFYPNGQREGMLEYRGNREADALAFAYEHLNGRRHRFRTGQYVTWFANQARRDADVLAVVGDEVLIEYAMPGTTNGRETSALVLCLGCADRLHHVRNYTHRKLPKRWVQAMHDQGTTDWIGEGQRESQPVPFPTI